MKRRKKSFIEARKMFTMSIEGLRYPTIAPPCLNNFLSQQKLENYSLCKTF
jgi:hypothetical protein